MTLSQTLNQVAGLNTSSAFIQDRSNVAIRGDQSRVDNGICVDSDKRPAGSRNPGGRSQ
jgi:hypothetical protein